MSDTDIYKTGTNRGLEMPSLYHMPIPRHVRAEQRLGIRHGELLDRVVTRFSEAKRLRRARELSWYLSVAFYIGDQYAHLSTDSMRILAGASAPKAKHLVRAQSNKIRPACNHLISTLVRSMPTLTASPATEDPADYESAQISSSILHSEWRRTNCTVKDHDIRTWKAICGTAGLWARWNANMGPIIPGAMGPQGVGGRPRGEIETIVVPPFNMYPDPSSSVNLRYFIHAEEVDADELMAQYPDLRPYLGPDKGRTGSEHYERRLRGLMGATLGAPGDVSPSGNSTTLMHYWEPRSTRFPDGLMAIATMGVILWMGPNPWAHWPDWLPIEVFRHHQLSASWFGEGAVPDAIPIQKEYNRTLSGIIEQRNNVSNPRYWIPRGCKVNIGQMKNAPGEKVWYTPPPIELSAAGRAYRPEREDPPPLPAGIFRLLDTLGREIQDSFSYHEVSKGQSPPGVRSGVAIEALQEKDEAVNVPIAQRDDQCWSRVGKRILALARKHWKDERLVEVRGDEGYTEVRAFKGTNIPSDVDVVVDTDTLLPITRAGKINALLDLAQHGVLSPMEVRSALFSGYGTIRAAVHRASLDQRKQQRENRKMIAGQYVPVDHYDNHSVHLEELNNYRKGPQFEQIRQKVVMLRGPDGQERPVRIGDLFEAHAKGHAIALVQSMRGKMALEATEGGQAGEQANGEPRGGANETAPKQPAAEASRTS